MAGDSAAAGYRLPVPVPSGYVENPERMRLARTVLRHHAAAGDAHGFVSRCLAAEGLSRTLDIGCGEGKLARFLPDGTWTGLGDSPDGAGSGKGHPAVRRQEWLINKRSTGTTGATVARSDQEVRTLQLVFGVLQVVTVILVAVAMALALAHALELPGKLRLDRETYRAVQPIYYPGFTIAGSAEPLAIVSTIVLLLVTPFGGAVFWLTLVALLGLVGMQTVYWLVTHPVNRFWVGDEKLGRFGSGFFSSGANRSRLGSDSRQPDWTQLRDRWEYSHVARAGLASASLLALVVAITVNG